MFPRKRLSDRRAVINWKSGTVGWIGLVTYVATWDYVVASVFRGETLTSGFRRGAEHRTLRVLVIGGWLVTTLHLFGRLPPRLDPYVRVGARFGARELSEK